MFSNIEDNRKMLEGAYRKLKTYYYYNKNNLAVRKKIAEFEDDPKGMEIIFLSLALFLQKPSKHQKYIDDLLNKTSFIPLPKKFVTDSKEYKDIVSNAIPKNKHLNSVNFFIDIPIELHIIDTLWTIILGKALYDVDALSDDVYGNTIINQAIYEPDFYKKENSLIEQVNFESNRLFDIYFYKYCQWRNNAFTCLNSNYTQGLHSFMFSLDIKGYFYSVEFDFRTLSKLLKEHPILKKVRHITQIIEHIFHNYHQAISLYRKQLTNKSEKYPLPIGLFSSMVLANLYLAEIDVSIREHPNVSYYGRYVDDILIVMSTNDMTILKTKSAEEIIDSLLVEKKILRKFNDNHVLKRKPNLVIQNDKIKIIHIDPNESRAMLDVYEKTIKILPSQMAVVPDYDVEISDFEETAFAIENFNKENKFRDIGHTNIDAFKVSRFFATIVRQHNGIAKFDDNYQKKIDQQIHKINNFFVGSQSLEFYSNWLNYLYFLKLCRDKDSEFKNFAKRIKREIEAIDGSSLDKTIYKRTKQIGKKTRDALNDHLRLAVSLALALDLPTIEKSGYKLYRELSIKLSQANMFDHSLVSIPLANYLEYKKEVSYHKMNLSQIGVIPKDLYTSFKFKWSPRFIHFEELYLLLYCENQKSGQSTDVIDLTNDESIQRFFELNNIRGERFRIATRPKEEHGYKKTRITIPYSQSLLTDKLHIAVGNIRIDEKKCESTLLDPSEGMDMDLKKSIRKMTAEAYQWRAKLLILPELYLPIYWVKELVDFSRRSQIAIITGLQYILLPNGKISNNIAVIMPFLSGADYRFKNASVFIREKNDYSPIELDILAKHGKYCKDQAIPQYQIFEWNDLDIVPFLCYEFTDIMARALMRGEAEILTVSEYNKDTSYFSDIICSATRDLHAIIVQSNTSNYGDSRITCPYDRDSKDILKIKGGNNESVLVGTVKIKSLVDYQAHYYKQQDMRLRSLAEKRGLNIKEKTKADCTTCPKNKLKPEIKKLSARFNPAHAKRKLAMVYKHTLMKEGLKEDE